MGRPIEVEPPAVDLEAEAGRRLTWHARWLLACDPGSVEGVSARVRAEIVRLDQTGWAATRQLAALEEFLDGLDLLEPALRFVDTCMSFRGETKPQIGGS